MPDYTNLGLTSNFQSVNSLSQKSIAINGADFDLEQDRSIITESKIGSGVIRNVNIGTAVIGTANIGTLSFNEITGGTINVTADMGGTNLKLDGGNKRIIVNDGTTDRILIGYQANGF